MANGPWLDPEPHSVDGRSSSSNLSRPKSPGSCRSVERSKQRTRCAHHRSVCRPSTCNVADHPVQIAWLTIIGVQAVTVLVMIALVYWKISSATAGSAVELYESNVQLTSVATYLAIFIMSQCVCMACKLARR